MQRRRLALAVVLPVALAASGGATLASAQRVGSIEAGAFGQWSKLADSLGFNNPVGGGGRLGLFVLPNVAAEADIAFHRATGQRFNAVDVTYRPARFGVVWNPPVPSERVRLLVGGGYTLAVYKGDTTRNQYEDGVGGLAGLRFYVNPSWSVRTEFLADRFLSPGPNGEKFNTKGYWNFAVRAGVSFVTPAVERCTVTLSPTSSTLEVGQTQQFAATVLGERTGRPWTGARVAFAASDNNINPQTGVYTARSAGTARVWVTARGRGCSAVAQTSANSATVTVREPDVLVRIDLKPDSATVRPGEAVQFSVRGILRSGRDSTVSPSYTATTGGIDASGRFTAPRDCAAPNITVSAGVRDRGQSLTDSSPVTVVCPPGQDTVYFDLGSGDLNAAAQDKLRQLARTFRGNQQLRVVIQGHADTVQPRGLGQRRANTPRAKTFNDSLSLARANSVRNFLTTQEGVVAERLEVILQGFGFCAPAVPHSPNDFKIDPATGRPAGQPLNRRATITSFTEAPPPGQWVCRGTPQPVTPRP